MTNDKNAEPKKLEKGAPSHRDTYPFARPKQVALYDASQVYLLEQAWFKQGNSSFGLMQQAAWQMAMWLQQQQKQVQQHSQPRVQVWVGGGNNAGDGWLLAYFLQLAGWQVLVVDVGQIEISSAHANSLASKSSSPKLSNKQDRNLSDAAMAKQMASRICHTVIFSGGDFSSGYFAGGYSADEQNQEGLDEIHAAIYNSHDIYVDALFGIGLDRPVTGKYAHAIQLFNQQVKRHQAQAVSIDIPSGLSATTGSAFGGVVINADVTLCLVARKLGLHIKDGRDHCGQIIDFPLIPLFSLSDSATSETDSSDATIHANIHDASKPKAMLRDQPARLCRRQNNSHKGSYGHVLLVGGGYVQSAQGMGGAVILAASSAFAVGVGKVTAACHEHFHGALVAAVPNAMTLNSHDSQALSDAISQVDVVAVGMGLGRDDWSFTCFCQTINAAIHHRKDLLIDADGLYHLATLAQVKDETSSIADASADLRADAKLLAQLKQHAEQHTLWCTPHSGEMARLLGISADAVEADRLAAIDAAAAQYGGHWVLKGAGSLVYEHGQLFVCDVGNAGMASAGMGDALSGAAAGLLAQKALSESERSLCQAVLIHGQAGDWVASQKGVWGLQAQDMPEAMSQIMHRITCNA